jgi:hypothetical protein
MRDLLKEHGLAEYNFESEELVTWGEVMATFCKCSKIYGYLTDEYMDKWKQTLTFIYSLARVDERPCIPYVWALFFCSDYDMAFSIYHDPDLDKVDVRQMSVCSLELGRRFHVGSL